MFLDCERIRKKMLKKTKWGWFFLCGGDVGGESVDSHCMSDCICHMTDNHSNQFLGRLAGQMGNQSMGNKLLDVLCMLLWMTKCEWKCQIDLHLDLALTAEQTQLGEVLRGVWSAQGGCGLCTDLYHVRKYQTVCMWFSTYNISRARSHSARSVHAG